MPVNFTMEKDAIIKAVDETVEHGNGKVTVVIEAGKITTIQITTEWEINYGP